MAVKTWVWIMRGLAVCAKVKATLRVRGHPAVSPATVFAMTKKTVRAAGTRVARFVHVCWMSFNVLQADVCTTLKYVTVLPTAAVVTNP